MKVTTWPTVTSPFRFSQAPSAKMLMTVIVAAAPCRTLTTAHQFSTGNCAESSRSITSRIIRNQLPFQYRTDFLKITDGTDLVPVTLEVPNREMSFKEKDGVQTATLDVFGRVSTLSGRIAQTFEDTVKQQIPNSLLQQSLDGRSIYQKAIPLRPGLYRLDLVVKDVNSGNVGVINTRLPVPMGL